MRHQRLCIITLSALSLALAWPILRPGAGEAQAAPARGRRPAMAGPATAMTSPPGAMRLVKPGTACTADEEWDLGNKVPVSAAKRFLHPPKKKKEAYESILDAVSLRIAARNPELQRFAEYWMWRALYQLKLIHPAHLRLNQMIERGFTKEAVNIQMAALECLNRIHQTYPSMVISPLTADKIMTTKFDGLISPDRRASYRDTMLEAIAMRSMVRILRGEDGANGEGLAAEFKFLEHGGPYEALVKSQVAARAGYAAHAVRYSRQFERLELPPVLKKYQDLVHQNLARVYYGAGQYDAALKEYGLVTNTSNLFTQTLSERAWAFLMKKQYGDAIGSSYNLMAGGLANSFAPDASIVMAISHFETCHYPEAYQALRHFRMTYDKPYHWLKANVEGTQPAMGSLYRTLVDYMKEGREPASANVLKDAPEMLIKEWIRSPVFVAHQLELNLIFDERDQITYLNRALSHAHFRSHQRQQGARALRGTLVKFRNQLPLLEQPLIAAIDADLKARNAMMLAQITSAAENSQLVEIEVFNAAGNEMIMENARPGYRAAIMARKAELAKKKKPDEGAVLDWGRFPNQEGEKAEVWEDELGSLRTKVTDSCAH